MYLPIRAAPVLAPNRIVGIGGEGLVGVVRIVIEPALHFHAFAQELAPQAVCAPVKSLLRRENSSARRYFRHDNVFNPLRGPIHELDMRVAVSGFLRVTVAAFHAPVGYVSHIAEQMRGLTVVERAWRFGGSCEMRGSKRTCSISRARCRWPAWC